MRKLILVGFTLGLISISLFGQTYKGASVDNIKSYKCFLRINSDSTIKFVYNFQYYGIYCEYLGIIKRLNDTLYHISANMTTGQYYVKAIGSGDGNFGKDSIFIQIDSSRARQIKNIEIKYPDSTVTRQAIDYYHHGKPIGVFKIPVDNYIFNWKMNTVNLIIKTDIKDNETGKLLTFIARYSSKVNFTNDYNLDFDVVIKGKHLWTSGNPPLQTGHLKMRMKK